MKRQKEREQVYQPEEQPEAAQPPRVSRKK